MATNADRSRREEAFSGESGEDVQCPAPAPSLLARCSLPLLQHTNSPGNSTMMQFFEWYVPKDGHWRRYAEQVPRLSSMGITACWIPRE
jgi:hypothetical protein